MKKSEIMTDDLKLKMLQDEDLGGVKWKSLDDQAYCLHCDKPFKGRNIRIYYTKRSEFMLGCPTAKCNGSPLDFYPTQWWKEQK